jgi:hypothetical protein
LAPTSPLAGELKKSVKEYKTMKSLMITVATAALAMTAVPAVSQAQEVYGTVGYAIDPLGDMQNLFNNGGPKGAGTVAIMDALANGGKTLDAFSGHLTDLYSQLGFVETGRMDFDPAYMPKGWDIDADGEPDVVFMAWRGLPGTPEEVIARATNKANWTKYEPTARRFTDYDEAKQHALASFRGAEADAEASRKAVRAYVDAAGNANGTQGDGSLQSVGRARAGALNPSVAGALAGAGTAPRKEKRKKKKFCDAALVS